MEQDAYHQALLNRQQYEGEVVAYIAHACRAALLTAPTDSAISGVSSAHDGVFTVTDLDGTRYTITIKPE